MFKRIIIDALTDRYNAQISEAEATMKIYLEKPVGIGEHSDLVSAVDHEVAKLANARDKLNTLHEFWEC